jgi:hypothetical protein
LELEIDFSDTVEHNLQSLSADTALEIVDREASNMKKRTFDLTPITEEIERIVSSLNDQK